MKRLTNLFLCMSAASVAVVTAQTTLSFAIICTKNSRFAA